MDNKQSSTLGDVGGFAASLLSPGGLFSGGMSLLGGLAGLFQGKTEQQRMEEKYNRLANAKLENANEANQSLSPDSYARAAQQQISATQQGAIGSALNMAAGNQAASGDFSNGMGAAVAGSQAAQAAGAPYAAQMGQAQQQAYQGQAQKVNQSESIANSQANLSNHVSYLSQNPQNKLLNLLKGLQAGASGGSDIFAMLNGTNFKTNPGPNNVQAGA